MIYVRLSHQYGFNVRGCYPMPSSTCTPTAKVGTSTPCQIFDLRPLPFFFLFHFLHLGEHVREGPPVSKGIFPDAGASGSRNDRLALDANDMSDASNHHTNASSPRRLLSFLYLIESCFRFGRGHRLCGNANQSAMSLVHQPLYAARKQFSRANARGGPTSAYLFTQNHTTSVHS